MKTRKVQKSLSHLGPHDILKGDLGVIGVPGILYTPRSGNGFGVVVVAHDWLTPAHYYDGLLRHLASWGIVAAAPSTQTGPLASDTLLASDLLAVTSMLTEMRLGNGDVSLNKYLLGFLGHGFGAGSAVIAAQDPEFKAQTKALALAWPKPTSQRAQEAAPNVAVPSLLLAGENHASLTDNAAALALSLGGTVTYRSVQDASSSDLCATSFARRILTGIKPNRKAAAGLYAHITGYFLSTLNRDPAYHAYSDPAQAIGKSTVVNREELEESLQHARFH